MPDAIIATVRTMEFAISYHPAEGARECVDQPGFSIIIPTWNSLELLKICVRSVRENSQFFHQIIIHINEGIDGTLEWVREEGLDYTLSSENCGICYGMNAAASLARTDYLAYLNDDMYVLPDWDAPLWSEIESLGHNRFFLSATLIEPVESGNNCVLAPYSFGQSPEEFREKELLEAAPGLPSRDWCGATWPLNVVHRDLWNLVGGYSTELTPGFASDPDFSMKLWQYGVRYFKGLGDSKVYHFMSKSTGRLSRSKIPANDGRTQFLAKWGITISTFAKYYTRLGQDWEGPLEEHSMTSRARWDQWRGKVKLAAKSLFS